MDASGFRSSLYVLLHNSLHQEKQEKRKLLFFECTQQDFNIGKTLLEIIHLGMGADVK